MWVKRELAYSLNQSRFEGKIVPLVYRRCFHDNLSWTLSTIQMIDFRRSLDDGCPELLRVWGIGYDPDLTS